uniref:L1 transposable element RRM domain-containing protein n=1 Tax=Latimeria chalumnae TaxID=7897 RepID=H3AZ64_LATCH
PSDIKVIRSMLLRMSTAIEEIKETNKDFLRRLKEVEQRTGTLEEKSASTEEQMTALKAEIATLTRRVDDQENRRRNNLRILGFPEASEKGKPIQFLQVALPELLQLPENTVLDLEHAHRSLAPHPSEGQRPCPFIVKFLRFPMKELILHKARELGTLTWQGHRILIFPDLSRDLMEWRKKFLEVKRGLREHNLQYGLFYPATLKVTVNRVDSSFTSPKEAQAFLEEWKDPPGSLHP